MTDSYFSCVMRKYQAEAPVNIEGMIRAFGLDLDKNADLDQDIAGQIERMPDSRYKIAVNKKDHYYRQRFTMAHELGHYLLHRDMIGSGVDDDRMYRSTSRGSFHNTAFRHIHETQANQFATSALMPKLLLLEERKKIAASVSVDDGEQIESELAKEFQVSRKAMEIILRDLRMAGRYASD